MGKENAINRENEGIKSKSIESEMAVTDNSDKTVSTILEAETVTSTFSTIMEVKTTATTIEADTASKRTKEVQNMQQSFKNKGIQK